jgi:hypothetical protein
MAAVKGTQKMLEHSLENILISDILDYSKYDKMLFTLESYSVKLDKLLETTSNIEQESKRMTRWQ